MSLSQSFLLRAGLAILGVADASAQATLPGRRIEVKPQGEFATIDTSGAIRDIDTFKKGSDADKDALVARMKARPGDFMPPVFMNMAGRLYERKDLEGAYFWFCFGRLRGRYDAARCADITARGGVTIFVNGVDPELRKYLGKMNPDDIVPFAKRVLKQDDDAPYSYDHRWINLHGMSALRDEGKSLSVPKSEWPALRAKARAEYLKGAEEATVQLKSQKK